MREENENRIRIATRDDWKTEDMPLQHDTFILNRCFSEEEETAHYKR